MSVHIGAEPGQIAPTVLLPGDPLRAQWIAQTYLTDPVCYSTVRNMVGFTGRYQGVEISVQGTGMGMPSAAIYVEELLAEYGARTLIRVGSCGALAGGLALRDVVAAIGASSDSAMNRMRFDGLVDYAPVADFALLRTAVDVAAARDTVLRVGPVVSSDIFYHPRPDLYDRLAEYGVLAVEMETAALYTLAAKFGAKALSILTVSDVIATGERLGSEDRERSFADMVEIALATVVA